MCLIVFLAVNSNVREAINKLVSSATKWTLQHPASSRTAQAPWIGLVVSTFYPPLRRASKPLVVIQAPFNPATDKGKGMATEGINKETMEVFNLPAWLAPLTTIAVEFYPSHPRKHATFVGKAQTMMM